MRNKYPGICYRCGEHVAVGDGHFERFLSGWRTQHATCAIKFRGTPDPAREAIQEARTQRLALGTGKAANRARKRLKDRALAEKEAG